jgi:hypothetical protein
MTNIDCRDLLAHHLIPFGYHTENIEWFLIVVIWVSWLL